jgi:hypothetical protein
MLHKTSEDGIAIWSRAERDVLLAAVDMMRVKILFKSDKHLPFGQQMASRGL